MADTQTSTEETLKAAPDGAKTPAPGGAEAPAPAEAGKLSLTGRRKAAAGLAGLVLVAAAVFWFLRPAPGQPPAQGPSQTEHPLLAEARDYYRQNNYKRAMVSAKELLSLQPENAEAHQMVGQILLADERPREAAEAARGALAIDPDVAETHALLGQAHLLTGQWSQALESSRRALILDPGVGQAYRVIGEVYLRQNRLADSIAVFQEAKKLLPPNADLLNKLGGAYIRNSNFAEAGAVLNEALGLDGNAPGVHFNLARVYVETGDGVRAIQHMEAAERLYAEAENTLWSSKARHNKMAIARKFHMTPDSVSP